VARSCSAVPPNERLAWLWRACGRACVARACLPWGRGSWHCEWDFGRGIRASHVGGGGRPRLMLGLLVPWQAARMPTVEHDRWLLLCTVPGLVPGLAPESEASQLRQDHVSGLLLETMMVSALQVTHPPSDTGCTHTCCAVISQTGRWKDWGIQADRRCDQHVSQRRTMDR
jgi:hypothetical protein